ncbi:Prp18 domain-containing protein [Phakopsora pachyrhizi]|nr:Prp18 domain-containing protein [Phakopsora pachyrhizi]KAI8460243.1 Prp18 domain-containing protein [Phakopsora pachyrhizi]
MDTLRAVVELKRKGTGNLSVDGTPPAKRYVRKGDLEKARLEAERREREQKQQEQEQQSKSKSGQSSEIQSIDSNRNDGEQFSKAEDGLENESGQHQPELFNISNEEAVRRLRNKGQPIRLFGESDKERRLRLRALQLIEERTEGGRNELMQALEGVEGKMDLEELIAKRARNSINSQIKSKQAGPEGSAGLSENETGERDDDDAEVIVDLDLIKTDPRKVYPQIYFALKRVLKEWEQSMAERPDQVRRSTQGKLVAATQKQSAEYLKPLFKSLRKRDLAPDVLQEVAKIVHYMQTREYIQANDAYLRLSIGNAPWPIGVTMVGIHERSGREKIFSNNVAHVLNDEVSRKYIQSLKRILTFAQTKRPPDDLARKMG